jgi:DNA polymerase
MGVDFVPLSGEWMPGERGGAVAVGQPAPPVAATVRAAPSVAAAAPATRTAPVASRPAPAPVAAVAPASEPAARVIVEAKPRVLNTKQQAVQAKLDALRAKYEKDAPHSKFVTDHHCIVFGDGDPCARLMIIGEAPGAEEDKVGIPFVGRAGQLLEKMLGGMGLKRGDVYITNVLKTRPPNNATPTADEAAACAPYLFEQIKIIGPEAILALGLPATRVLLNSTDSMSRLRGRWTNYVDPRTVGYEVPVMPTYHPAFLLRSYTRENREKVWSDLQMIMTKLGLKAGKDAGMGSA